MLHGQRQVLLREVEHVEDAVLRAAVLTVVDGTHHLHDGFALVHHLLLAVLPDDGQLALHQYAVVHHGVVVPAQLLPGGEHILHRHQLGPPLQIVGQFHAVSALRGADEFGAHHRRGGIVHLCVSLVAGNHTNHCAANEGGGHHPNLNLLFHHCLVFI